MKAQRPFPEVDIAALPSPLSQVLGDLVTARFERGAAGAAAETSRAVDAFFELLGALVLAEYLNARAPNSEVNRHVFQLLDRRGPILTGEWIAVARECLHALREFWKCGEAPTWPSLAALEVGEPDEAAHPVNRLLQFRNNFSHGVFLHETDVVIEHGELLEAYTSPLLVELTQKPIGFQHPNGQVGLLGQHHTDLAKPPPDLPPYTPFVRLGQERWRILAPALRVVSEAQECLLKPSQFGEYSSDDRFVAFEVALEEYRKEQRGHVRFPPSQVPQKPERMGFEVGDFDKRLEIATGLTLIEYRPGTNQQGIAAHTWSFFEEMGIHAFVWRVIPSHPSASGSLFARALLRKAEEMLALEEGVLEPHDLKLPAALEAAAKRFTADKQSVAVVIMDAARGADRAPGDELSVLDICRSLPRSCSLRAILLAPPSHGTPLPHDGPVLTVPAPSREHLDVHELTDFVAGWRKTHGLISDAVMGWLLDGEGEQSCFLAEALEVIAKRVESAPFPTAIEHALWTAAPILVRSRDDDGRFNWRIPGGRKGAFGDALKTILNTGGR